MLIPVSDPPKVLDGSVRFRLPDPDHAYESVQLHCDHAVPVPNKIFSRRDGLWELKIPRPPLARMEYQLLVRDAGGDDDERYLLDPSNPVTVETAFGAKSVVELPGYRRPWWLTAPVVEGVLAPLHVTGETRDAVPMTMWSPYDSTPDQPLPLLLVHDGPEYDLLALLTRYTAAMIEAGRLPSHRVALLHPVQRDAWYSGSPRYLRTEVGAAMSHMRDLYAVSGPVAVMGASLGGLTALLAGLLGAPDIGAVFSQSGSFFQVARDHSTVSSFPYFGRIARQVDAVLTARHTDHPLRIGITCGALEENVANNRDMAAALRRVGHVVSYAEVPDLHSYTAWRDSLDPHLTDVLRDCWGATG